jgi:hypothetical protein
MSGTTVETQINDPLQYLAGLPYTARYYPMGFPADIAANSRAVLEAAQASWSLYHLRFDQPPVRMHVIVSEDGDHAPEAVLRGQQNILVWMADQRNFAVLDSRRRFAFAFVTRATVADCVFFRWHYLEAVVLTLQEMSYYTSLHAACLAWEGSGVALYGDSGVGKSTLAYACARRGWTYISDDGISLLWSGGRIAIGESHHFRFRAEAPEIFPELRGLTVGRQLDRKPTIEVHTANLPIRTAPECRVDRIVFLNRTAGARAVLMPVPAAAVRERLRQDMPVFDPDSEEQRLGIVNSICELPAFELRYGEFEDAAAMLERLVQGRETV